MFEIKEYIEASRDYAETRKENYELWQRKCWENAIKRGNKYSNIGLYGAGNHTRKFLEFCDLEGITLEKVRCIIALEKQEQIRNIPVVTMDEARERYHIDGVIISSKIFQEEIDSRIKSYDMQEIDVIKIYEQEYKEESTERSYAYYDENHRLRCNIPFDHLQRYGWALGYVRDKTVIDMACGSGYGSYWMSFAAAEVIGIDVSRHAIEHAEKMYHRPNCRFFCENIYNIREDIIADVIVSFETIEHIDCEEEFFRTVERLLKPEGTLLISTPLSAEDGISRENGFHTQ
ncbi:class I SAM-dependent methyltransferase [Lachnospiraceae bacterium 62-35]